MLLSLFASLVLAAAASGATLDCPTPDTAFGRRRIAGGERSCADVEERGRREAIADRPVSDADRRKVIAHFDVTLFDGPSARWRWLKVVEGTVVCGYVNAKNRMGGYVGWTPFSLDTVSGEGRIYTGSVDAEVMFGPRCLND